MLDNKSYIKIQSASEKNFGLTFSFVFLIISIYFYFFHNEYFIYLIFSSLFFLVFSFVKPIIFKYPNYLWNKIGIYLGYIVSPLIMAIIFFVILFPTSLVIRIFKKDLIGKNINSNINSYWINVEKEKISLEDQF